MHKILDLANLGIMLSKQQQRRWSACAICTFVVRIWHKQIFSWYGSNTPVSKSSQHFQIPVDFKACHEPDGKQIQIERDYTKWTTFFWRTCHENSESNFPMTSVMTSLKKWGKSTHAAFFFLTSVYDFYNKIRMHVIADLTSFPLV